MELLVITIFACALALGVRTAVLATFPEIDLQDASEERKREAGKARQERLRAWADKVGAKAPASKEDDSTRQRLERAGLKMQPDTYKGLTAISTLACAAAGMIVALVVSPKFGMVPAMFVFVLFLTLGMAIPSRMVTRAEKKRAKRLEADLPAMLELLSISVRAGFPLERAIKLIAQRGIGPLADEFRIVDREVNMLSVPIDRSLERMSERCGCCQGVRSFVLAVNQSHRQGTSITRVLDSQAQISRSKFYADLLVKVNKLPNKMVAVIFVCFLPVLIVGPVVPVVANTIPTLVGIFPTLSSFFGM